MRPNSVKQIIFVCSCIVSFFLAVMSITEIFDALQHSGQYPFGSEFFGPLSIYKSLTKYVLFHSVVLCLLLLTIVAAWKRFYKIYWTLVAVILLVLLYPTMTN